MMINILKGEKMQNGLLMLREDGWSQQELAVISQHFKSDRGRIVELGRTGTSSFRLERGAAISAVTERFQTSLVRNQTPISFHGSGGSQSPAVASASTVPSHLELPVVRP